MLIRFDDGLAGEATRISGLLTSIHPALERVLGPRVTHPGIARDSVPIRRPHRHPRRQAEIDRDRSRKRTQNGAIAVVEIYAALESQTVVVPGSASTVTVLPKQADSLNYSPRTPASHPRSIDQEPRPAVNPREVGQP